MSLPRSRKLITKIKRIPKRAKRGDKPAADYWGCYKSGITAERMIVHMARFFVEQSPSE